MRILVTFAVEAEFAPWKALREFVPAKATGLDLWSSTERDSRISVLLTGIGEKAAALAMDLMMRAADRDAYFDICLSSGLAGALRTDYQPGDVVAAVALKSGIVHQDLDRDLLESDQRLLDLAVTLGAKPAPAFFTADRVLTTVEEKSSLASKADVVEMESFDVLKEGFAWGARGIAIRAISDRFDEDLPIDFNRTFSSAHGVSIPRILVEVARKPAALGRLIRFGKQSRHAAESLSQFLETYVTRLTLLDLAPSPSAVVVQ